MTDSQLVLLDQLLTEGLAEHTESILNNKVTITIHSLTTADQLKVESYLKNMDGVPAYVVHNYSIKLVSTILKKYHVVGKEPVLFQSPEEVEKFLLKMPSFVVDAIILVHSKFEKELTSLIKDPDLEENFIKTQSAEQEPS